MKKIPFIFFAILFVSSAFAADIKEADLAGSWYPASKAELQDLLRGYLDGAKVEDVDGRILGIISPHAGYQFSGPVAGYGFRLAGAKAVKTVIVIGFTAGHGKLYDCISVYLKGAWRTPLGDIKIDEDLARAIISKNPRIKFDPAVFSQEQSVEMQIPFVQEAFKDARICPIALGTQRFEDASILADALASCINGRSDILIVASTDLSHYHPYAEANSIDSHTIEVIKSLKAEDIFREAELGICELCGSMPVTALMLTAKRLGYDKIKVLKYANSGDTSGDKGRVVGYLSAVVYKEGFRVQGTGDRGHGEEKKEGNMLNDAQRKRLLEIARESVASYVRDGKRKIFEEKDPVLNENFGAFVTLHEGGELRGCIGNMVGQGPLYQTVAAMAVEASTGDPRFTALSAGEVNKIDIEISVLSPLEKVKSPEEIKIPGHGVLIRRGLASGVYLPQVATETGWNKAEFLASLCAHKAGLPPDAWKDPSTDIYVFTAEVFGEK